MEFVSPSPNVLFLPGISLKDYVAIEDVFDDKVLEGVEAEDLGARVDPFMPIPRVFTSLKEWPYKTNLACWSCTFTFDSPPKFASPYIREGAGGELEAGVEGNFCCFNCAALYIDVTYPPQAFPDKHWRMRDNLCYVYFIFTGIRVKHIPAALDKRRLKKYGGDLSDEEFWEALRGLDPLHGIRDHRLGTTVPERFRVAGQTVWELFSSEESLATSSSGGLAEFPPSAPEVPGPDAPELPGRDADEVADIGGGGPDTPAKVKPGAVADETAVDLDDAELDLDALISELED